MDEQAKSNSNANKPTNPSIFDFDIPTFENVKYLDSHSINIKTTLYHILCSRHGEYV
jgi:hypothetical protein